MNLFSDKMSKAAANEWLNCMLMDSLGWRPNHEPPSSSGGKTKTWWKNYYKNMVFTDFVKKLFWIFENYICAGAVAFYK